MLNIIKYYENTNYNKNIRFTCPSNTFIKYKIL